MTETYVLHITKKCNMNCSYCYEQDKESEYTWEEIKDTIDNIFSKTTEKAHIEFLGGEPMLRWDLVKKSFEYINTNYNKLLKYATITTNGTVLNDEIIEFLKNNELQYAISLDGTKYSNQLRFMKDYSCGYDVVVPNIVKLIENKISVNVHIVTHPYNIAWMFENIKHLYELGVRHIGIGTIQGTIIIDENYCNIFKQQIKLISDFVIKHPGLTIDLFDWIKPKTDIRTYVKDLSGKTIFESYGRLENDVTYSNNPNYIIVRCDKEDGISEMIYSIREYSYNFHKENKMGLIQQQGAIIDCVGKVGLCDLVTDPTTDKLYKNKILFPETSTDEAITKDYTEELKKDICSDSCKCKEDDNFQELVASALKQIILQLNDIQTKLNK